MQEKVKNALKDAITKSLPILYPLYTQLTEPYLEWYRDENLQWQASWVDRSSSYLTFREAREFLHETSAEFIKIFCEYYPQYTNLVGTRGCFINIVNDPSGILKSALGELWNRHEATQVTNESIEILLQEFAKFIDCPTLKFHYTATLLNYKMDAEAVQLPNNLVIRQLSEREASKMYGGPMSMIPFNLKRSFSVPYSVLEGEFEELKVYENYEKFNESGFDVKSKLNQVILVLRTFKSGPVGYDCIHIRPKGFCPLPKITSIQTGDAYIPFGIYQISKNEVDTLRNHAMLIFSGLDQAMEMACRRLAEAESRTRFQDRLLDAAIGLESILLAGLSKDDRRSELKFRFSLNYSTLFNTPEKRSHAYRIAKDIYDLRSAIAHGSSIKEPCRLGDKKVGLDEAAQTACDVLRSVISYFLPEVKSAPYTKPIFWENGYFGVEPRL
ncbi:MAG: hypothetical protein KME12_00430 [Trichocoleus desertorum ATA4-8-CV12]|jgi:hypothetical protein|nr:hypothetical protein [Trichocoleus desertorum ATA4-8-CV12]